LQVSCHPILPNSTKPKFAQSTRDAIIHGDRERSNPMNFYVSSRACVIKTFPDKFAQRFPAHNGLADVPVQIAARHSSHPSRCVSPRVRYEIRGNVLMYERAARRRSMVDKCAVDSEGFVKCRSRS